MSEKHFLKTTDTHILCSATKHKLKVIKYFPKISEIEFSKQFLKIEGR